MPPLLPTSKPVGAVVKRSRLKVVPSGERFGLAETPPPMKLTVAPAVRARLAKVRLAVTPRFGVTGKPVINVDWPWLTVKVPVDSLLATPAVRLAMKLNNPPLRLTVLATA